MPYCWAVRKLATFPDQFADQGYRAAREHVILIHNIDRLRSPDDQEKKRRRHNDDQLPDLEDFLDGPPTSQV